MRCLQNERSGAEDDVRLLELVVAELVAMRPDELEHLVEPPRETLLVARLDGGDGPAVEPAEPLGLLVGEAVPVLVAMRTITVAAGWGCCCWSGVWRRLARHRTRARARCPGPARP